MRTNEIKNEINDIKKGKENIKQKDLKYETEKYKYDFQENDAIRSFGDNIYTGKLVQMKKKYIKKETLIKVHMLFVKFKN